MIAPRRRLGPAAIIAVGLLAGTAGLLGLPEEEIDSLEKAGVI